MITTKSIGEKIAIARKFKNLSQAELAAMVSVSSQAVGKWERGESMPDIIMFKKLAELLGTDVNYFTDTQTDISSLSSTAKVIKNKTKANDGWDMSFGNWVDADFSGLTGLADKFNCSNINKCKFIDSELSCLMLKGNNIQESDFTDSNMQNCNFVGSNLEHNTMASCDLSGSTFDKSNISNCIMSNSNMSNINAKFSAFSGITFRKTIINNAKFHKCGFDKIVFSDEIVSSSFNGCEFHKTTFDGATLINCFFKHCKIKKAKFINCKVDKLTYAFLKACNASLDEVSIIENI